MPRKQKLKVYRTPIGFHDAYVAAPSQKAALAAWGTDANLFARGVAELVTDEALTQEPLAAPGKVIKRLRGTADEQLAALPPSPPKSKKALVALEEEASRRRSKPSRPASAMKPAPKPKAAPKPRPSRAAMERAQEALQTLLQRQEREMKALVDRERALERERRELERAHERERKAAERSANKEREALSKALARWIDAGR